MPGLLQTVPVTDEERRAHDRHRPIVVVAVLAVLCLHLYLLTVVYVPLGLPAPQELAQRVGIAPRHVFDPVDRIVEWEEPIAIQRFDPGTGLNDEEWGEYERRPRLPPNEMAFPLFYVVLMAAFVSVYFVPLAYKQPVLMGWSIVGTAVLYGWPATCGLLLAHLIVHQILHPPGHGWESPLAGLLAGFAFDLPPAMWIVLPVAWFLSYRYAVLPALARPRVAPALRTIVVQSALLVVTAGALAEGLGQNEWVLPLGILLFFWHWSRLMLYHVDFKDGQVPRDISLPAYLCVFFTPGAIPYWDWGPEIGQGYTYPTRNFLCQDKNRLAWSGVKLLLISLFYLVCWKWVRYALVDLFDGWNIPVFEAETRRLVRYFAQGGAVSTISVLSTTMLDLLRWLMIVGGLVHFRVGIWRICGYRIDAFFDKPWLATNLVTFWTRFTFHLREFLLRAFYYPVFFRFFKRHPKTRIIVATMAAVGVGNLIWGHLTEQMFDEGLLYANLEYTLGTWPYFLLLGIGISVTELYLLWRKRRRKAWTWGPRIALDVLAAYGTMQFYALIHIFARPTPESTVSDLFRLFLRAFFIEL